MPNSVITAAGLALFADALHTGATVTIDRIVFADVPGLDPAVTPDENQGVPPAAQIMLDAAIEKAGRVDANTVVYSKILTATDGNWYINWIGLYSTQHKTLVAVCVAPRHYKFKTDGFQAGNTLYKNFALQYANAGALTGITIAPETWQYDFDTRYALKDHNHDTRYEPLGAVKAHNEAAGPHPGRFDAAGAATSAVNAHNSAADPHAGKFEKAGAVNTHNAAADAHDGKFEKAGAVNTHNADANAHSGKFAAAGHNHDTVYEAKGAVTTHNSAAAPHPGKFDAAGTAAAAVNAHNSAADPHAGKFAAAGHNHNGVYEPAGAVATHNAAADAHPDIRAKISPGKAMFEIFSSLSGETPPGAYPLWTGETIANCRTLYPDFWAKAVALQSAGKIRTLAAAAYNTELSAYGETGAFVIDTSAGSIRLPKIVHFVRSIEALAAIGTAENDDFKSHTHTTPNGTLFVRTAVHAPGADGDHWHKNDDGSNVTGAAGGSETRPKNVRAAMYIQVYSAAVPASTAQAAEFVNGLSGKADRNFGNIELAAALANLGFSGTAAANGYQKLPGGLIVQWGEITPSIKGDNISAANWEQYKTAFPVAFLSGCYSLVAVRKQTADGQDISVDSATLVKFDKTHYLIQDRFTNNRPFAWIAVGR